MSTIVDLAETNAYGDDCLLAIEHVITNGVATLSVYDDGAICLQQMTKGPKRSHSRQIVMNLSAAELRELAAAVERAGGEG